MALAFFSRSREPVVYEVRLEIDAAIAHEYDDWLRDHAREMLSFPGFQSATVYRGADLTENHRVVRVVVYDVRSRRELDSYLHTHAPRMREDGTRRFGKRFTATRRILPAAQYALPEGLAPQYGKQEISDGLPVCGNCMQPVPGRYCVHCGQEDRTFMLSMGELAYDFIGDLFNFDSRFFRTLKPLLFRPGLLTTEYLRGRRQQYLPPVRMYIFISLLFFFFAALVTDFEEEGIVVDGSETTEAGAEIVVDPDALTDEQRATIERRLRDAARDAGLDADALRLPERPADTERETAAANDAEKKDDAASVGSVWDFSEENFSARIERGAESISNNPAAFARAVLQQIPTMMFFFLPLIAVALKLLYVGTGRYYVEHLIFTLHFHSAVFVLLLLWLMFRELAEAWTLLQAIMSWVTAAAWIYIPYYLYRSLRRVYGQGRMFTLLKYILLMIAYVTALTTTFVLTLLYTFYVQT